MAASGRQNARSAVALAVAAGKTQEEAAAAAGVGVRTVGRWWADPVFRRRVAQLQQEMVGRCLGRMADGMAEAADVLRNLLTARSESVRLGAARAMLELGVRVRDAVELGDRVEELERLAAAQSEGGVYE